MCPCSREPARKGRGLRGQGRVDEQIGSDIGPGTAVALSVVPGMSPAAVGSWGAWVCGRWVAQVPPCWSWKAPDVEGCGHTLRSVGEAIPFTEVNKQHMDGV